MTKMPERIALSHAFGGLAAALVGVSEYHAPAHAQHRPRSRWARSGFEVLPRLPDVHRQPDGVRQAAGLITGAPVTWKGQNALNIALFFGAARRCWCYS